MAGNFKVEHVARTPRGWHVRTVTQGDHEVRIAFPPGQRQTGSGHVVEILHPRHENPSSCVAKMRMPNPAELVLISGINPMPERSGGRPSRSQRMSSALYAIKWHTGNVSQAFQSRAAAEKVLERFHGKGELIRVNPMPLSGERYKNPVGAEAEQAIEIREGFVHRGSKGYRVMNEPHITAGDYAELGPLVALGVKPTSLGNTDQVQEIGFARKPILLSDTSRRQLYFAAGDQRLTSSELRTFTSHLTGTAELGVCETIVYIAAKYHPEVGNDAAGKKVEWIHPFGEENGIKPTLWYDTEHQRLILRGGDYRIEDRGIVN